MMAARPVGSGMISFGLVSIPFKTYKATFAKAVSFNLLHNACGARLKDGACPVCEPGRPVPREDRVRGFEYARDQYVTFTDEELHALEADRTGVLEIQDIVPADSVDSMFIARTYFLGPGQGADRAYRLLSQALQRAQRVAVGRFVQRGKATLVIVRPYEGGLVLQECFYADQVRPFGAVDTGGSFDFKPIELELADQIVRQLHHGRFEPARFRDEWADRVMAAVERKVAGEEVTTAPPAPRAQIIDLLDALKRSVERSEAAAANTQESHPVPRKRAEVVRLRDRAAKE
jgi:DNA end-binding protein Ku